MFMQILPRQWYLILFVAVASCLPLRATNHYVSVDDSGFLPANLTIDVGDTVIWINTDEVFSHTTTSDARFPDPDAWNGILFGELDTFSKTFDNPGVFPYGDQVDIGRGTITVVSGGGNPTEIKLESAQLLDGKFVFDAIGLTPVKDTILEASTNLVNWTPVSTNVALDTTMTFTNTISPGARFFRVYQVP
jgi:plastocyanin